MTSLQEKGGKAKSQPRYNFDLNQGDGDSLICDIPFTGTIDDPVDTEKSK